MSLEDFSDINSLVFEPDYQQSAIHSELFLPNWQISQFKLIQSITHYDSNFGDISTPKGLFSRLTFTIDIKHNGWGAYFNYFVALEFLWKEQEAKRVMFSSIVGTISSLAYLTCVGIATYYAVIS